jgi:segregation and condensation protein A
MQNGDEILEFEGSQIENLPENVNLVDLIEQPAWKTILIELVKSEKMDPWNIDVTELAGKYLQKINLLGGTDLRIPANAILASAILLKFKSRILSIKPLDEEEAAEALAMQQQLTPEQIAELEASLPELTSIRKLREGKVSLDELVFGIEKMLEQSKARVDKRFIQLERPEFKIPFGNFNIDEKMEELYTIIVEKADSQGLLTFSMLPSNSVTETVESFIACLFLTNNERINMWQEDFFGEIFINVIRK